MIVHVLMRDEKKEKEASKIKQTNEAKQHSTPKAVTFPKKNELPRVGLEPTTRQLGPTDVYTSPPSSLPPQKSNP